MGRTRRSERPSPLTQERGYTMVELMVGLGLLAMLTATVALLWGSVSNAMSGVFVKAAQSASAQTISQALTTAITDSYCVTGPRTNGNNTSNVPRCGNNGNGHQGGSGASSLAERLYLYPSGSSSATPTDTLYVYYYDPFASQRVKASQKLSCSGAVAGQTTPVHLTPMEFVLQDASGITIFDLKGVAGLLASSTSHGSGQGNGDGNSKGNGGGNGSGGGGNNQTSSGYPFLVQWGQQKPFFTVQADYYLYSTYSGSASICSLGGVTENTGLYIPQLSGTTNKGSGK